MDLNTAKIALHDHLFKPKPVNRLKYDLEERCFQEEEEWWGTKLSLMFKIRIYKSNGLSLYSSSAG